MGCKGAGWFLMTEFSEPGIFAVIGANNDDVIGRETRGQQAFCRSLCVTRSREYTCPYRSMVGRRHAHTNDAPGSFPFELAIGTASMFESL